MKLKRIELRNFKRFRFSDSAAPFTFSPGINVVKGPLNETGKSTLLEGIVAALFYDVKSVKEEVKDCVSWGSDRQYETLVEFEEKGKTYSLHKDFEKGLVSFIGHNTGEKFDTSKKVSGKMKELLGTDSDEFFSLTSCIYQNQVKEISSGKKEISDSLEEVVTEGKEGILASQAMKKLDGKISEMKKGLGGQAKIPGILVSLTKDLQNTLQTYDKVKDEVSKIEAKKTELVDVKKQLTDVKERYENVKALLGKNEERRKIKESIKELRQKYGEVKKRLDGISELMAKLEKANKALRFIEGFEDERRVSEFGKGLDAIQNSRVGIENGLAQRKKELAEANERLDRRKFVRFFGSGSGIATAIIILIGGIIGTLVGPLYLLSLIIVGAVLLVISRWAGATLARENTTISDIKRRIQDMEEALDKLGEEEKELLAKAKCSVVGEFDKKEKDFKFSLEETRRLEAELKGMLMGNTVDVLQKQEQEIATDLTVAVKKAEFTGDLEATELSLERRFELEKEVQNLGEKKARLEKQEMECEISIMQATFNIEDQIKLEEERDRLKEELKQEEKRVKIYELANRFISKARDEALSSITGNLKEKIQEYFEIFTNGKYKQVEINKDSKGNLEFWIYSDEKGGLAKPEELSGGVIDEFYLACRLALVNLIFGDKKPPLILDDPFVNFDSVRLANTLSFLKTLASEYQIIIFTLGDLYDKVADNIILLGEKGRPL
jgi:DNA repair exonuclease SbcCD ATPase subunit